MKASWGKIPIGVIAILCAAAFAIVGLHRFSGRAYSQPTTPPLFVTDYCTGAVTAYPAGSNGDVSPLAPAPTGLADPGFVAIDASGNIYALNLCNKTITVYAKRSNGDAAPTAIIGGSNTGLISPAGIAVDSAGNIYVADDGEAAEEPSIPASVFVYSAGSNGNAAPIATISGSNTGLTNPIGIAVDSSRNIYVAQLYTASVLVYSALGSSTGLLNEPPTSTISGYDTDLFSPSGVAVDSSGNIYVSDAGNGSIDFPPSVFVYSAGSNGDQAPTAIISGGNTGLTYPIGIALDSSRNIYVPDKGAGMVFVYSAGSDGNEAPTATISGSNKDLESIALDSSRNIYVTDINSVLVYSAVGSSTGTLNESPIATISTTMTTGLTSPRGIALDSSGNIYVGDCPACYGEVGAPSVFVYPAGSNANVAPIATISGSSTGLIQPAGVAVDSSGKIYVADDGNPEAFPATPANVFVYSAGSNGNVAPIATITGSKTGLSFGISIAVDSSGNIYVAESYSATVLVYSAGSTGNVAPTAILFGPNTDLGGPIGIAVDSSGKIYVADESSASVTVYPALVSSTRPVNVAPIATISGSNTGLILPIGIALDSSGNIYVADGGNPYYQGLASSVSAYPPLGGSGWIAGPPATYSVAPTATISGPVTELFDPQFVAIQPAAGPTPTPTLTATPTPTLTVTPTATATGVTPTPTPTATATPTTTLSAAPAKLNLGSVDASCSFEVEFAPATPGVVSDQTIEVGYNGASPAMSLSGTGIAVTLKAPKSESFTAVDAGVTGKAKNIELSNSSTVPVTLETAALGAPDPGSFKIAGDGCSGQVLAPKSKCTVAVEFAPPGTASGTQTSTLSFGFTYGANSGSVSTALKSKVK
jgi:sugar lactone lactonase YvrE